MNTTKKLFISRNFIAILICVSSIFFADCSKKSDIKNPDSENLYRIRINRKWGFINYEGEIKIPCEYSYASDFNEDEICKVSKGENYFYINKKNKIIKNYKGTIEYIDPYVYKNTEVKQPPVVPEGLMVCCENPYLGEGYYLVCINEEDDFNESIIDSEGRIIIQSILSGAGCFRNGMAPFKYGHSGIDGYLRKDGVIFDFSNWK